MPPSVNLSSHVVNDRAHAEKPAMRRAKPVQFLHQIEQSGGDSGDSPLVADASQSALDPSFGGLLFEWNWLFAALLCHATLSTPFSSDSGRPLFINIIGLIAQDSLCQ